MPRDCENSHKGLPLREFFCGQNQSRRSAWDSREEDVGMVHFYCPVCWKELDQDFAQCPHCSADIHSFWKSKDFVEKLIVALDHPEPSTVIRSVWLLGQIGDCRAVEPLKRLLDRTQDLYVIRAAKRTLDELHGADVQTS